MIKKFKDFLNESYNINNNMELTDENIYDFIFDLMEILSNGVYSANHSYKFVNGVLIRVKSHKPNWANFIDDDGVARAKFILNVTVGDNERNNFSSGKMTEEEFNEMFPDVDTIDYKVEYGDTLSYTVDNIKALTKRFPLKINENCIPQTREIGGGMFKRNYHFENDDNEFISYIEKRTGLHFVKSLNSNSWYCGDIRISDHFTKGNYTCYFFNESPEYISRKINKISPFGDFRKGDTIYHSSPSIGKCQFISYNPEGQYVEVKTSDGSVHKYFEEKFANNINFEQKCKYFQ